MTEAVVKKSDLGTRALSAVVMVAVAGAALWLGGWIWAIFVAAIASGVLWEWAALVRRFAKSALSLWAWVLGGVVYIGLSALELVILGNTVLFSSLSPLLIILLAVICTDVGAYMTGRLVGGPKIAPAISPSKTWSGLAGGAIAAGALLVWATIMYRTPGDLAPRGIPWSQFGWGVVIAVVAQTGDFFESWMKRRAGVKDSGTLIPGHGGLFDRVDGLLAVTFVGALIHLSVIATFRPSGI